MPGHVILLLLTRKPRNVNSDALRIDFAKLIDIHADIKMPITSYALRSSSLSDVIRLIPINDNVLHIREGRLQSLLKNSGGGFDVRSYVAEKAIVIISLDVSSS